MYKYHYNEGNKSYSKKRSRCHPRDPGYVSIPEVILLRTKTIPPGYENNKKGIEEKCENAGVRK